MKANQIQYFMGIAHKIAEGSKDESTKVGCVLVGPANIIGSTGYNGFARNCLDDIPSRHQRPTKYIFTVHAEINAICNAARLGVALEGFTAFVTTFPCAGCASALSQAGIKQIYTYPQDVVAISRWGQDPRDATDILMETRVQVITL